MLIDKAFNSHYGFAIKNTVGILYSDTDPTSGSGINEPKGTLLFYVPSSGEPILYKKYGSGATEWKKLGIAAWVSSSAPTVNNDGVDTAGTGRTFEIGDIWIKTTATVALYFCTSNTTGAAVWNQSASGGGLSTDNGILPFGKHISTDVTITSDKNALSAGPVEIDSGVTVTISSDSVWTIV